MTTILQLERKDQPDTTTVLLSGRVLLAPDVDENYWTYRVVVGERQAVVGFPKLGTIGIGFAYEADWNTNLPYTKDTLAIWRHIQHNKGDQAIPDEWCIEAIRMIQRAATEDRSQQ